jgi:hypothetical protein
MIPHLMPYSYSSTMGYRFNSSMGFIWDLNVLSYMLLILVSMQLGSIMFNV